MSLGGNPIKFGTDGWRGIIAREFTFDNVRVCAQGVADYLLEAKLAGKGIVVGYDTRFASEHFAAASAEVIAGNGIKVYLCSRAAPTPVVSFATLDRGAGGAIVITASHNPGMWNGFKYKSEHASSASGEITARIEKYISRTLASGKIKHMLLAGALERGMVQHFDPTPSYLEHISKLVDLAELRRSGLKIVIDSMYGAGAGYFRTLLGKGMEISELNGKRNPLFPGIQPEPIAANLAKLSATVRRQRAAVGLATDGDADRVGVVDEKGTFLTPLQVFSLLCLYLLEVRRQRGALVKTIATSSMVYPLGEMFKVPVYETPVGFKYVAPIMMAENALIGGEESGGYGFRGHIPERDGILAGLYFLDLMVKTGKTPSQLVDYLYGKVGPHHFKRLDVEFPEGEREAIIERVRSSLPRSIDGVKVARVDPTDGFRFILADTTWLLIRFSGTEPVLRIYSESDSLARVDRLLEAGKKLAGV
ncbi:MAG: phosphoglucomutase/phosphomannomutase family protein [Chloroflexi bacterium]|nr:phosphoglucomutase/phosphomannomutase family protein [Chloroflexota bacterium]